MPHATAIWCCFFYPSAEKLLGNTLNVSFVFLSLPQSFFNSQLPFLSLMLLLFSFLVAICVGLSFFFPPIALFHRYSPSLSKKVSIGLSVDYLRVDSFPLSIPWCLGFPSAL